MLFGIAQSFEATVALQQYLALSYASVRKHVAFKLSLSEFPVEINQKGS